MTLYKEETGVSGLVIVQPKRFGDDLGWFTETWNAGHMCDVGIDLHFVQDNHFFSSEKGTLRGLHYQKAPPCAGQARPVLARGSPRCGGGYAQGVADLRGMADRGAECREWQVASRPQGVSARIFDAYR